MSWASSRAELRRGGLSGFEHLEVIEGTTRHAGREFDTRLSPSTSASKMTSGDGFKHGGHAHERRAESCDHCDLGGRLVVRTPKTDVDAFAQRRIAWRGATGPQAGDCRDR